MFLIEEERAMDAAEILVDKMRKGDLTPQDLLKGLMTELVREAYREGYKLM